jgi:predicted ribosomally synthesized peptide with nif11-like leader
MSHSDIQPIKAENLSTEELRLQKVQQAIDDLFMTANQNEVLKRQLEAATSPESLVEVAARQGYQLTVADLETLHHRIQEQAQLNADDLDDDELSEEELELVAGGGFFSSITRIFVPHNNNKAVEGSRTTAAFKVKP